jgi:hypothetical protein
VTDNRDVFLQIMNLINPIDAIPSSGLRYGLLILLGEHVNQKKAVQDRQDR